MCGIAGEIRLDGARPDVGAVHAMTQALRSRGPDGEGLVARGAVAFGHRRLKIIDLSDRSRQPMVDPELGLTVVYNGAIYNYKALRRELEGEGYAFSSDGDTEVVLKAYHRWGSEALHRLNGMFAFAIHHHDSDSVFLARDRLGIKPLYFTRDRRRLRFASTLPALLSAGNVDTGVDPVGLHHYMTFHSIVPPPHTILRGVQKLPPGCCMTVATDGQGRTRRYWELEARTAASGDGQGDDLPTRREEWAELVHDRLHEAVARRMTADVPVGVLLSGGLDSSLVVSLLAEQGQKGLRTFSIGFESLEEEAGDEFEYSDAVVETFGTEHHKIHADAGWTLTSLQPCVRAMSEPMVSHDCVGFYLLSQEVARHVKVVQSGQGADEVFAGYHWYPPLLATDSTGEDQYMRVFFDRDHEEYARAVHPRFVDRNYSREFLDAHFGQLEGSTAINKAMHMDTTVMLVDDPVKRVDNMTMAWGLEGRVPFLDHELVELAFRVPAALKVGEGGKLILKDVARKMLPAKVIDRPKGYFPVPALKRLRGAFATQVRDLLSDPVARGRQLFNADYVQEVLDDPDAHMTPLRGSKAWQMALLEYWLQEHGL